MAPFMRRHCPRCLADTWQHFLLREDAPPDAEDELWAICESCETVLIYRADGSVGQRTATAEERSAIPPRPDLSSEPWVTLRKELRQGRADLRAWLEAGCPGLTPELEGALPPGTLDRLRRFVESPDGEGAPERHA
jgi:hypothetical protein